MQAKLEDRPRNKIDPLLSGRRFPPSIKTTSRRELDVIPVSPKDQPPLTMIRHPLWVAGWNKSIHTDVDGRPQDNWPKSGNTTPRMKQTLPLYWCVNRQAWTSTQAVVCAIAKPRKRGLLAIHYTRQRSLNSYHQHLITPIPVNMSQKYLSIL